MIEGTDLHWKGAPQGSLAVIRPPDVPCLRFRPGGRWLFPAFRFDPTDHQVLPSLNRIIAAARAAGCSDLRLLNWLMQPHFDFDSTPAGMPAHPDDVLAAPLREHEPQERG